MTGCGGSGPVGGIEVNPLVPVNAEPCRQPQDFLQEGQHLGALALQIGNELLDCRQKHQNVVNAYNGVRDALDQ